MPPPKAPRLESSSPPLPSPVSAALSEEAPPILESEAPSLGLDLPVDPESAPASSAPDEPASPPSNPGAGPLDPTWFWQHFLQELARAKPLAASCTNEGRLLDLGDGHCTIGFGEESRFMADRLDTPAEKAALQQAAAAVAGRPMQVRVHIQSGLTADPVELPDLLDEPTAPASPALSLEEFKNDPAMQKALALFRGEVESIQASRSHS